MIGRLLAALATLVSVGATLGLAGYLELDRMQGTPVYLPVEHLGGDDSDLINLHLREPVSSAVMGESWRVRTEDHGYLELTVDPEGRVTAATRTTERPTDGLWLRIRNHAVAPMSTRLPPQDHEAVRYLLIRVTPGGEAYEVALADEELRLLGRGDRAW